MKEEHKISWRALRYSHIYDNKIFQIGMAFIFGLMVVLSLVFKNYFFGVFILIASLMLFHIKKNENPYINIDIDNNGISINNELILYNKISVFFIDESEEENYLLCRLKNTLMNSTKIIIIEPEVDINELREFLLQHLPEKEIKQ